MTSISQFMERIWYSTHVVRFILLPFSWIYILFIYVRQIFYQSGLLTIKEVEAPVIVVGNISAGGTGKTPLVIWLAEYLQAQGYRPGIISRGYGGKAIKKPQRVVAGADPAIVGDEPVLIANHTHCPVMVSIKKQLSAQALIEDHNCDFILSDDGLQHYALDRDIEIVMIDGQRHFGNGLCLPAGPLREPLGRLDSVDLVVSKNAAYRHAFMLEFEYFEPVSLIDAHQKIAIEHWRNKTVHAIAGIANPDHFFAYLRHHNIKILAHRFPDHYPFSQEEIHFNDGLPVVMTEKDAVKCMRFATQQHWYLPVKAKLPQAFVRRLNVLIQEIEYG